MRLTLKTKIWITVLSIVLMFAFFILFYFPAEQEKHLLNNYNKEVQNLANTVALGVKIALTEQNFEGVSTAMDFVKGDAHLYSVSLIQTDTLWNNNRTHYQIESKVFKTYPDHVNVNVNMESNDMIIVKKAPFHTTMMDGEILLAFTTKEITQSKRQIRLTSIVVSIIVFIIGIIIGFWLSRNISVPVLALRDAANKVGEGDLTQRVISNSKDEIGELGIAFNKMVDDLSKAQKQVLERSNELMAEKRKSDDLLLNILPAETADELKANGSAKAKNYESVSVLFADFKGFTKLSEQLNPEQLVAELNYFFSAFDQIIQKHNIEKIKTIGDAYMCAAGLPVKNNTHSKDIILAAMEMRNFIDHHNQKNKANSGSGLIFEIRIGINTGPVVAGIVGLRKFAYDIWGDAVNIASRMETCSEPGKINISGATYQLVKNDFRCIYRGKINAKNKGEIDMYFVENLNEPQREFKEKFENEINTINNS